MNRFVACLILASALGEVEGRAGSPALAIHTGPVARPLLNASRILGKNLGLPVDYEDPEISYFGDLVDITNSVVKTGNAGNTTRLPTSILGRKLTSLDVEVAYSAGADPATVLQQVLDSYNRSSSAHAVFALKQLGHHLQIVPQRAHDHSGAMISTPALLDTMLTMSSDTNNLHTLLNQFCDELSHASGKVIRLGTIPTNYVNQSVSTTVAGKRLARETLIQILDSSAWSLSLTPSPKRQLVWQLLYEPSQQFFVLNLSFAEIASPSPNGGVAIRPLTRP